MKFVPNKTHTLGAKGRRKLRRLSRKMTSFINQPHIKNKIDAAFRESIIYGTGYLNLSEEDFK